MDYLFVSKGQFEQWVEEDELLEHALVYGDYKGIPRHQVHSALQRGTDVVLRVDVQGAATIRRLIPDSVSIFLVRLCIPSFPVAAIEPLPAYALRAASLAPA